MIHNTTKVVLKGTIENILVDFNIFTDKTKRNTCLGIWKLKMEVKIIKYYYKRAKQSPNVIYSGRNQPIPVKCITTPGTEIYQYQELIIYFTSRY